MLIGLLLTHYQDPDHQHFSRDVFVWPGAIVVLLLEFVGEPLNNQLQGVLEILKQLKYHQMLCNELVKTKFARTQCTLEEIKNQHPRFLDNT